MTLHDPPNLNLPALKIKKKDDRKLIESDDAVRNLISSNLLLDKDLNQLLSQILGITKEINALLEKKDERVFPFRHSYLSNMKFSHSYLRLRVARKLKRGTQAQRKEFEEEMERQLETEVKKRNQKIKNKIKRFSDRIQSELDSFERRHGVKLNIPDSLNLHICKKCNRIVCLDRFHTKKCKCGTDISAPSDCDTIIVQKFGDNMIKFIENNMWLEHGIDHLLKKKEFTTLCGVYILGHSGIGHEIDNVAELNSEKLRVFCECKNKDITVNDVFVFSGKMADIGCTRGYIFTTSFDTSKEVKHLARTKNITIIEEVLEKSDKKIMKEIREGFEIKKK